MEDDNSSERSLFEPLASMIMSTTSDMVSLACSFSESFPNRKVFPSTQERDSQYFSLTLFKDNITSLHWLAILLFLVVDPSGLLVSSMEVGDDEGEVPAGDGVKLHDIVDSRDGESGVHECARFLSLI